MHYDSLRLGEYIFLANCWVGESQVQAGFGFFNGGSPDSFPLSHRGVRVAVVEIPDEAKGNINPVAMGDYDSPIILKRLDT